MPEVLRLRLFAGPNGSGKSTMINAIRAERVNGRPIDIGAYLNADDIGKELRSARRYDLAQFGVPVDGSKFRGFATASSLLGPRFTSSEFSSGHSWSGTIFNLKRPDLVERFAQLITAYLCDALLSAKKKFSFETVFSHASKLELMRKANKAGYKVYLYFISTESPEINIDRVGIRVKQGGHDVPAETIRKRYNGAMEQLYPAMHLAYRTYLFDNSEFRSPGEVPAEPYFASLRFRLSPVIVEWNYTPRRKPDWFERYVTSKIGTGTI